jgi:hypothetical protein
LRRPARAPTTITNSSLGARNAAVSVNVAYKEDTDRAGQILKEIVAEMRRERRVDVGRKHRHRPRANWRK